VGRPRRSPGRWWTRSGRRQAGCNRRRTAVARDAWAARCDPAGDMCLHVRVQRGPVAASRPVFENFVSSRRSDLPRGARGRRSRPDPERRSARRSRSMHEVIVEGRLVGLTRLVRGTRTSSDFLNCNGRPPAPSCSGQALSRGLGIDAGDGVADLFIDRGAWARSGARLFQLGGGELEWLSGWARASSISSGVAAKARRSSRRLTGSVSSIAVWRRAASSSGNSMPRRVENRVTAAASSPRVERPQGDLEELLPGSPGFV
jgi:hypothetical protein